MSRNYYDIVNNRNKELIIKKSYTSSSNQFNNPIQITYYLLQIINNKKDDEFYNFFKKYIYTFEFKKYYIAIITNINEKDGKVIIDKNLTRFNKFHSVIDFIEKCCYISSLLDNTDDFYKELIITSISESDNYYKELYIYLIDIFSISQKIKEDEELSKSKETIIINNNEKKKKKKSISATVKRLVWNTNIGEDIGKAKCLCCNSTDITQMSFNCGHIIAEANGGETIVSNLKPICQNCNSSMGTKNMHDFMKSLK